MAQHRHKRETNARNVSRSALVAAPIALLATVSAVTVGVAAQDPTDSRDLIAGPSVAGDIGSVGADALERTPAVSRARSRVAVKAEKKAKDAKQDARQDAKAERQELEATRLAVRSADLRLWTTEELNLWSSPDRDAQQLGVLDSGERVLVTGRAEGGREEIVVGGESRWVTAGYLDEEKPVAGIGGECTNGSAVPSGVDPDIVKVHQAVCSSFPDITSYGTFRGDGEHSQGRAVDIMVSGARGWEVAEFVRANYVALGVEYLIYSQKIWSVERGGEGWRGMSDRGSATANHYDHVHVTVY